MESKRRRGTLMIARKDVDSAVLSAYIKATNKAIRSINTQPNEYATLYFTWFSKIIPRLSKELQTVAEKMRPTTITVPKWAEWAHTQRPISMMSMIGWLNTNSSSHVTDMKSLLI